MAKKDNEIKSYDRQPGESAQAFQAFELYLTMGDDRSYSKVAQALSKSGTIIRRWGSRDNWQDRLRDYQNDLAREERKRLEQEIKEMHRRHINLGKRLQKKATDALDELDKADVTQASILRYITDGAELELEGYKGLTAISDEETGEDRPDDLVDAIVEAFSGDDKE